MNKEGKQPIQRCFALVAAAVGPRQAGFLTPLLLLLHSVTGQGQPAFTISTVAGTGVAGYSGDGGQAAAAALNTPNGVSVDSSNNLYISDGNNNRIRKVTPDGTVITFAGSGATGFSGDGGPATDASLTVLRSSIDTAGNLYIVDYSNHRIRKITPAGIITTVAGNGNRLYSGDRGPATDASMYFPQDVATDRAGNLFIVDWGNAAIRKIDTNGIMTTVAGNGTEGYSGDGGPATEASLDRPEAVTVNAAEDLFIATTDNRIRKVSNGIITTVAGTGDLGYSGDGGPGTSARLSHPSAVRVDAGGNLYIADRDNNAVRVLLVNGTIWTVAGNGTAGFSGDGGKAAAAMLASPRGLAISSLGNIYVGDSRNNRVRLLTPIWPGVPSIARDGVVPVYSYSNIIQAGSWISIYGNNLASGWTRSNGDFPTSLGGTSVTIDNKPGYLSSVSPYQINLQAPDDTASGIVNVSVTTPNGTATSTVTLAQFGPSFSLLDGRHVAGVILRFDGSGAYGGGAYDIVGPPGTLLGYKTVAAKAGDTLILFGVGFGPTNPRVAAGAAYSGAAATSNSVQLLINNVPVTPAFSGITSAGLYQLNVVGVPSGLGAGDVPLLATVGGVLTPLGVVLSLE